MPYTLEVCVDSVESAVAAEKGGATRLELCANLIIGGTTPTMALYDAVCEAVALPVNVLIRPRFGDFLYTDSEYEIMCREIDAFARRGVHGIVTGALCPDGCLDVKKMTGFRQAACGVHMTLHRAFDVCRDPLETLEEALALGVDTVLTSGQQANAWAGRALIGTLRASAANRAEILIGGGVNGSVIRDFRQLFPDANAFHLSGKTALDSGMTYRNEAVYMGLPGISEFQIWRTNADAIQAASEALREA